MDWGRPRPYWPPPIHLPFGYLASGLTSSDASLRTMPVLLREADFGAWLDGSAGPEVLQPAAESALREWTVDRRVNKTGEGDDDPTIVEPVAMAG